MRGVGGHPGGGQTRLPTASACWRAWRPTDSCPLLCHLQRLTARANALALECAFTSATEEQKAWLHHQRPCGGGLAREELLWEVFTDAVISSLARRPRAEPLVFLLWGNSAREKAKLIAAAAPAGGRPHLVLQAAHPSGLSANRGFFGCKHFSRANAFLVEAGVAPINWQIL